MPVTILPHPTQTRACPHPNCGRTVGPYYDAVQADQALATHERMAHVDVRTAQSYVPVADWAV